MGEAATAEKDFRKILERKDVDAITIATPEHWHAPMAIAGLQAGKHVYVESHAATILLRARCWCRRSRSIASSCRWVHSSAPHPTPSRSSKKFTKGLSAGHTLRNAGTSIPGNPLGQVKKCPFHRSLIGICGRVRHRDVLIRIMCTPTTGTGSESMAPVKR